MIKAASSNEIFDALMDKLHNDDAEFVELSEGTIDPKDFGINIDGDKIVHLKDFQATEISPNGIPDHQLLAL